MYSIGARTGRGSRRVFFNNSRPYRERDDHRYRTERENHNTRSVKDDMDLKTMSKSLDQVTDLLQAVTKRLDNLENPNRTSRPRGRRPRYNSTRESSYSRDSRASTTVTSRTSSPTKGVDPLPQQLRNILNFTRVIHHADNWKDCPNGIANVIDKLIRNIHPPLPSEDVRTKLQQLGEDFKTQIREVILDHLDSRAGTLMDSIEPLSDRDVRIFTQDVLTEIKRGKSRIREDTVTSAFDRLIQIKPKPSTSSTTDIVPETPIKKRGRNTSDEDNLSRTRKTKAADIEPDETPDLSEISEGEEAERNLTALADAATKCLPNIKFFKWDKRLGRRSTKWNLYDVNTDCETLILTGSNGKHFEKFDIPDKTQVLCIPGLNLEKTVDMLQRAKVHPPALKVFVFCVGFNDRKINDQTQFTSWLKDLEQWCTRLKIQPVFSGISHAQTLPAQEKINIGLINVLMKDIIQPHYIPPLLEEEVVIEKDDWHAIHFDRNTAKLWFDKIMAFLNDIPA